jgi:Anti-sigma regulatory factor (Ser/Thr protein kinase)
MIDNTLKLASNSKSICKLEEFINCIAERYDIGQDKYPDILISLTEAVNNAIIHGNREDQEKYVLVVVHESTKTLTFTVHDEGQGFDPLKVPDPTCPEYIDCCGGRGVFLMKQLADEVRYLNDGRSVRMRFSV